MYICLLAIALFYYSFIRPVTDVFIDKSVHVCLLSLVLRAGDSLVINEYDPDESNQKWHWTGEKLESVENPDMVLDVSECNCDPGTRICQWEYSGGDNQHWTINHM